MMESQISPLLSSRGVDSSLHSLTLSEGENTPDLPSGPNHVPPDNGEGDYSPAAIPVHIIAPSGDFILEYASPGNHPPVLPGAVTHRWQVSSQDLSQNSPYFRALLDPNKFSEGREFMNQKALQQYQIVGTETADPSADGQIQIQIQNNNALPTVRLPVNHFSPKLGLDVIQLFLRILSYNSLPEEENAGFNAELRSRPVSLISRLVELADAFNSPRVVQAALRRAGYALRKPKAPLTRFNSAMLKFPEDRIRQTIYVARFLGDQTVFQMLTHTLIVTGSRFWANGFETPDSVPFRWHYLPDGLEEELYYRRQCILNTITDLQAYFLRIYGALEEPIISKTSIPNPSIAATAIQSRQYQCRCGLGNSSACDAFHLGQMTRFFALRTRTIFLGSTLIDPDFNPDLELDDEHEHEHGHEHEHEHEHYTCPSHSHPHSYYQPPPSMTTRTPPSDITALISSLKQCPDYQIDVNHTGCGIRRRFLPPLDCIEGFVGDERGLIGVKLPASSSPSSSDPSSPPSSPSVLDRRNEGEGGEGKWPRAKGSWANRSLRRALVIDIRLARIGGVPLMTPGVAGAQSREEDARLLFTAKKRNWEA